jgi:hypothetical protein
VVETFISFRFGQKIIDTIIKTIFKKIAKYPNITIVPTKTLVCCTALGLAFTLLVKFTIRNTADIRNAILQYVTILEKKRNLFFSVYFFVKIYLLPQPSQSLPFA